MHAAETLAAACEVFQGAKLCASPAVPTLMRLLKSPPTVADHKRTYVATCANTLAAICKECPANQDAVTDAGAWPTLLGLLCTDLAREYGDFPRSIMAAMIAMCDEDGSPGACLANKAVAVEWPTLLPHLQLLAKESAGHVDYKVKEDTAKVARLLSGKKR